MAAEADDRARIARLQARIDAALVETPEMSAASRFSEYDLRQTDRFEPLFVAAAGDGGVAGLERVLDAFDASAATADPLALRRDLTVFLTRHRDVARLGLTLPSLRTRSPWKTLPSKR